MTNSQRELFDYLIKPRTVLEVAKYLSTGYGTAHRRLSVLVERKHAKVIRQGKLYLYEAVSPA